MYGSSLIYYITYTVGRKILRMFNCGTVEQFRTETILILIDIS